LDFWHPSSFAASLCFVTRFKIGAIAEAVDECAGIGFNKAGSFVSGAEPPEEVHFGLFFVFLSSAPD